MSAPSLPAAPPQTEVPWSLWKSQVSGLLRLEVKKYLLSKRALLLYFLAFLPIFPFLIWNLRAMLVGDLPDIAQASMFYAGMFQTLMLHLVIFFACVITFTNLFRGEVLEHSLHYYFLCPVRREVLVVGKYIAGQFASWIIFLICVVISFCLVYFPYGGQGLDYFTSGPAIGHLLAYMGVTVLAFLGYGAVFLFTGLLFRNPIIPAIVIWIWEGINAFLPAMLQKISVSHYLISLCPVPLSGGPIRVIADPAPAWLSVPGLLLVTLAVLFLASLKIRHMEISYGGE